MERLTYRDQDGFAMMKKRGGFKGGGVERLAAYEDTGLTPEEIPTAVEMTKIYSLIDEYAKYDASDIPIGRIYELIKADKEGRVVVLPCKVGDILYRIFKEHTKCSPYGEQFEEYSCGGCECECDSSIQLVIRPIQPNTLSELMRYTEEIGKTVFLTRKEAEEALEETKNV